MRTHAYGSQQHESLCHRKSQHVDFEQLTGVLDRHVKHGLGRYDLVSLDMVTSLVGVNRLKADQKTGLTESHVQISKTTIGAIATAVATATASEH